MIGAVMAFSVLFDLLEMTKRRQGSKRVVYTILFTFLAVLYTILMALSRVVIAIHSWNQIIYGVLLGVWIICFCQFLARPKLNHFVDLHLNGSNAGINRKILLVLLSMAIFVGLEFIAYGIATKYRNKSEIEKATMIFNAK